MPQLADFVIDKATPTLSVTNSPVGYTGSPQAATVVGSVAGVVSDIQYDGVSTIPADIGTYAVTADFVPTDTANYNSLSDASAGNFVIGNADRAVVDVKIAGNTVGNDINIPLHSGDRKSFGVNNGPVEVVSTNGVDIIAAERVIYKVNGVNTSFTEMMGLPNSQLDTTYWLPWYNNVDLDTQLRFANVSGSTATVHVYIGGAEMQGSPFTLAAGASTRKSFAGVNNGPVKIVSNVNIVAAERVIYKVNGVNTSFSEMMALPNSQLDNTYWLPWYNNVDLDTQLRFANVSGSTATVHVYIGGVEMAGSPFTLAAGESTRKSFAGINNGPVKIVSDADIVAAERVIYKVNGVNTSFSEMMALPNSQLDTTYWLPWYNNVDLDTQLRFANVSGCTSHRACLHRRGGDDGQSLHPGCRARAHARALPGSTTDR